MIQPPLTPKLEALALLMLATGLRRRVPMQRWVRLVGSAHVASPLDPAAPWAERDLAVAGALASAVRRSPVQTTCLDRALAGALMLRRRGAHPVLVIGLAREAPEAEPHAWLKGEDGAIVVGAESIHEFVPVTEFR